MSETTSRVVSVEIQGLRYPIRSDLDAAYVQALASYVDGKMRAAADETGSGDPLKVAVLAALNIADEVFRRREVDQASGEALRAQTERIEALLDRAIGRLTHADAP